MSYVFASEFVASWAYPSEDAAAKVGPSYTHDHGLASVQYTANGEASSSSFFLLADYVPLESWRWESLLKLILCGQQYETSYGFHRLLHFLQCYSNSTPCKCLIYRHQLALVNELEDERLPMLV